MIRGTLATAPTQPQSPPTGRKGQWPKAKLTQPEHPTVTVTGTVSEICRHIASAHKLPELAEASSLVEWDDSEHTLAGSPLDKALSWLATTWPALTSATHSTNPKRP